MTKAGPGVFWADPGGAEAVAGRIVAELARPGEKRIAVPGGSTPLKIFQLLADWSLDWSGAVLVLTDDRQVPHDHPASNYGKLSTALKQSGATLCQLTEGEPIAPFDLVWLGMGEDGHVASLFPRMTAKEVSDPQAIATVPEPLPSEAPFPRLSLNLPALVAAREIILVVTGDAKRGLLERVLAGEAEDLPAARLFRAAICPVTIYWSP